MAASSRSAQYNQLHKVLKKLYKAVSPPADRAVLDHLLFASCLENAQYQAAEEAMASLVHSFYDFNEIRVSSVRELSEVLHGLPDGAAAALRVKRVLQSVFEASYSFDLQELCKLNLGPAVERLQKINGTTRFTVAYVVQAALGGHSIPADDGTLKALWTIDVITAEELEAGTLPGVERAIPKNKGVEFGSLLHQLGAQFTANPYSPQLHQLLLQINPDIKDRLPKRRAAKAGAPTAKASKRSASKARGESKEKKPAKAEADKAVSPKAKKAAGKAAERKGKGKTDEPVDEASAAVESVGGKKKPASAKKKAPGKKKPAAAKPKAGDKGGKEGASAGLTKRKPR